MTRRKRIVVCPCGCGNVGMGSDGFCPEHLAVLHRVRDEMNSVAGRSKTARDTMRRYQCALAGCEALRVKGARYCADHAEDEDVAA